MAVRNQFDRKISLKSDHWRSEEIFQEHEIGQGLDLNKARTWTERGLEQSVDSNKTCPWTKCRLEQSMDLNKA